MKVKSITVCPVPEDGSIELSDLSREQLIVIIRNLQAHVLELHERYSDDTEFFSFWYPFGAEGADDS